MIRVRPALILLAGTVVSLTDFKDDRIAGFQVRQDIFPGFLLLIGAHIIIGNIVFC